MEYFKLIVTIALFLLSKGKIMRDTITINDTDGIKTRVVKYSLLESLYDINKVIFYGYVLFSGLSIVLSIFILVFNNVEFLSFVGHVCFALSMALFSIGSALTDRTKKKY